MAEVRETESLGVDEGAAGEALADLSGQTTDKIRRLRAHERIEVRLRLTIQPGNASDLQRMKVRGVTGDLSTGGCRAVLPIPLRVGDVYRLTFDPDGMELPMVFARCVRCRLIREDVFEAGFAFFSRISIPDRRGDAPAEDLFA
jgi:hypothetical protein